MIRFPIFSRAALAGATLFLGLLSSMGTSRAVEPDPDYKTLIFPSIISKAGSLAPPANAPPGDIRTNYETYYENYWTDTSYHSYDPATGAKIRGFYIDTKTYGYIHMPWPVQRVSGLPLDTYTGPNPRVMGAGEPFEDGDRLYSEEITVVADAADADGVWTPGESFRDVNGNGQYDEYRPAEDFWNNDNTQVLLQRRDGAGVATGALVFPRGSYRGPVDNNAAWNATAGELYADYNDSTDLTNDTLGYDAAVNIFVAAGGAQTVVNLNELDLSPTDAASVNEGDFAHTAVADPAMLVGVPPANIPRNGVFDYTTTNADVPQVRAAAYRNGNALIVQYPSYVITNATTEAAGYVFRYADTLTVPPGAPPANAAIRTITVTVYQTGELYGVAKAPPAFPPANDYGDLPNVAANLWPNTRDVLSDNTRTVARVAEPFEDYLVFGGPGGRYRVDLDPAPPVRAGRGANDPNNPTISKAEYDAYIEWNYNGDATALINRAGNGRYDGPEAWTERQQTKVTVAPLPPPITTLEPTFNWGGAAFGFATWQDWWEAAFLSPAPAWNPLVANVNPYAPDAGPAASGWIPSQGWSYDSDREFCDLPSSMYHLGGDPTAVTAANYDPLQGFLRTDLAAAGLPMGDNYLGEITSPWSQNVYGQDVGPLPDPLNPDWVGPGAADNIIIAAGPFCFNIHGNNGHDAGNLLAMEYMTWRTTGDRVADPDYPANLRDTNLDGFLDTGNARVGDIFYANGGDGAGDYPYNRMRYMEDLIELWDGAQDFNDFVRPSDGVTDVPLYGYGIYEQTENPGSGGLGGPAGATTTFLTRDRVDPYDITFQIRPIDGGNLDDAVAGGTGITVSNVVTGANFAMGILCHEQGHDLLGWPDLYDYDVWNGQGATINTPIGAYDLMSGGGLVHGIPDFKAGLDGPPDPVNGLPWITPVDLETLVPLDGGPTVVELWPGEDFHENSFFRFRNPNTTNEYLYFYYYGSNSPYAPGAGGPGMYVTHTDVNSNPLGVPNQQRQNGHYTWEIVQADGLYHLQDGTNSGDGGDPFPGTANKRIFTEDTIPALRWWDQEEAGLRVLDIVLPTSIGQPARVTFERFSNPTTGIPYAGNDGDGDGIPDAWEVHYWGNTTIASGTSDFDHDGLSDLHEFILRLDPRNATQNGLATDLDGDGLSDRFELTSALTDPRLPDTDDDGLTDKQEVDQATNPNRSNSPYVLRQICNDGTGVINVPGSDPVDLGVTADRFDLPEFTIEAMVRLTRLPSDTGVPAILVRRIVEPFNWINYEIGVDLTNRPYVRFQDDLGTEYRVTGNAPLAVGEWTHVAGRFGPDETTGNTQLALFYNHVRISRDVTNADPVTGEQVGPLVMAQGLNGCIDEVRLWNIARDDEKIDNLVGKTLMFGYDAADAGSLTGGENGFMFGTSQNLNAWTASAWFRGEGDGEIVSVPSTTSGNDGAGLYNFRIRIVNGTPQASFDFQADVNVQVGQAPQQCQRRWGTITIDGDRPVNDGLWHYIAFTFDGATARLILDDQQVNAASFPPGINNPFWHLAPNEVGPFAYCSANYALASNGNAGINIARNYSGSVDEVAVVGAALGLAELVNNRFFKWSSTEPNLESYFDFDNINAADEQVVDKALGIIAGTLSGSAALQLDADANAPINATAVDILAEFLAGYFPMDDGRYTGVGGTRTNGVESVEDFRHPNDMRFAGTLSNTANIDFTPVVNSLVHGAPLSYPVFFPVPVDSPYRIDADGDGMPDVYEQYFNLDPSRTENQFRPDLGSFEDLDGDGLVNLYEYYAGTDPTFQDSDGDGILDADEDTDSDGLTNLNEQEFGSNPGRRDSDDDGFSDEQETRLNMATLGYLTNPADSMDFKDPLIANSADCRVRPKYMVLDGVAHQIPAPVLDRRRFNAANWTAEAWVYLDAANSSGSFIRYIGQSYPIPGGAPVNHTFYELGVTNGVPFVRMQGSATYTASSVTMGALPLNTWVHLAGVFDDNRDFLGLYVNGTLGAQQQVVGAALSGSGTAHNFPGKAYIGSSGLNGAIDDVRIWNYPRTMEEVRRGMEQLVQASEPGQICNFRFDDGRATDAGGNDIPDGILAAHGQGAEDFVHRLNSTDLESAWQYSLRGITFGCTLLDCPRTTGFDDVDSDGVADGWEDLYFSRTMQYVVPVFNGAGFIVDSVPTSVLLKGSDTAAFSSFDLGWSVDFTPIFSLPGRRLNAAPDKAYVFKDVFVENITGAQFEMRLAVPNNYNMYINGVLVTNITQAALDTFALRPNVQAQELYAPSDVLAPYFRAGRNRIAVELSNDDNLVPYEYFNMELVMNANQFLIRRGDDTAKESPDSARWHVYANPGSTTLPPVDGQGLQWYDLNYAVDSNDDLDGDGLATVTESLIRTNPKSGDTDGDGILDPSEDFDVDGLANAIEEQNETDPRLVDTDDDGIADNAEAAAFTDGTNSLTPLVGRILSLDGAPGSYMTIPSRIKYSATADFGVEAWVKMNALGADGDIIVREIQAGIFNYRLRVLADGRVELRYTRENHTGDEVLTTTQTLIPGVWTHVTGTLGALQTGRKLEIHIDGAVAAQKITSAKPATGGVGPLVHRAGPGLNASLDELKIWTIPLSPRSTGILSQPLTSIPSGLAGYFRFDDGTNAGNTSATPACMRRQAEDFTVAQDWENGWASAGTLSGAAAIIPAGACPAVHVEGADSDGDGMPDGWETANGLDPNTDDGGLDPDRDGLTNLDEYRAGTNPNLLDSNGNGIADANEDSDGDGLSNAIEVGVTMTLPGVADTDDDGVSDGDEVSGLLAGLHNRVSSPVNAFDPPTRRSMRFDGDGHVAINNQDRHNLKTWTIQAWVKPDPGADGVVIRRLAGIPGDPANPGTISYELGVKNVAGAIRPYVRYVGVNTTTLGALEVLVDGTGPTEIKGGSQATSQIAPLEWSHLAGTYDPDTHTLSLYINGDLSSYRTDAYEPVWLGLNAAVCSTPLTIGGGEVVLGVVQSGFEGWLDDVAILSGAMSATDIADYANSDVSKLDLLRAGSSVVTEEQQRPVYSVDEMLAFPHRDRELLIRFKPTVNRATYPAIATAWGTAQKRAFTQMPMLAVRITDDSTMADKIAQIKADPRVEYVQPNFTREFHKTPNDSRYGEMWGLHNAGQDGGLADADIDAPEAWVKSVGNDSVTVAVIDSGCDTSHPDIAPNLWVNPGEIAGNGVDDDGNGYVDDINGYDFGDNDPNVEDSVGHGTHTAGTIGAVGNNSLGVVGVNWKTRLMILKIGAADGSLPTDAIIAAIEYAWRNGAKVSNNSYGGYFFDQAEFDAWSAANQAGHLAVCSAGNDANDNDGFLPAYPCSFTLPNIISVAATDRLDEIADFSNFGLTSVDLGAPGVDILSTLPGTYGVYSGTSMAGPHVAGVATLLMASSPGLSIDAVKQTILATVDRVESLNGLVATGGRLNASRAVGGAGTPVLFLTFDDGGVTAEDSTYSRDWAYTDPWFHAGTLVNSAFDAAEFLNSQRDTDQDGLPDWWELAVGLDPNSADGNNGGDGDLDGDGLTNSSEYLANTNPRVVDTDRDGVSDFNEDLDGDGLSNAQEQTHGTNPLLADTDDDGVNDAVEIAQSTSPIDAMDPSVDRCMQVSGNGRLKIRSEIGTDVMGSGTVELWVKSDADGQNAILVRRAEMFAFNNQRWIDYEIGLQNGIPYGLFQFRINNTQLITQRVDACRPIGREWTHIAVVRDIENDQLRILVDGAYEGQTHTVQRPPLTTYGVFETTFGGGDLVGAAVQNGFRGCLDAVRVWSYARAGYALNTQRGDRYPEFTDTGFGLSAPLRVFNFDDGGTTAENSRYVQDWLHNWQHAADLQGDAAFQLSPWHPLTYDLDDDTVADNDERLGNTSIYQSEWPYVMRALQFPGGSDLRVDERMDGVETAFYALRQYTLECWVRPEAVPAGTATLIRRFTKAGNYSTFELGLENVAGGAVPYLKFNRSDAGKTAFTMRAGYPIPVGTGSEEWTHLAATYDDDNNLVMLQVNGTVVNMSTDTAAAPYTAPAGILQLGSPEFVGSMRDVRIWSTPRTAQQIRDQREENLLFKSAEIQYSFNGDSATFLGRATSTNAVDNESSYYLDYTTAVVDGYGYNLLLGHYTQPYTLQTWVNIPAAAATDNNILIERKLPVGVTDTGQNIYATCHSIRLDGNGRPYGYWEGTLFTYVYTTVGGNPPAVALNITVEAVDNAVGSEIDLRDGQWHHLALVGDGVNVTLYVDGRAEATRPYRIIDPARQRYQSTSSFGAVLRYGETFASGRLDEGVFWNTPLSSSQINQTMSLGLTSTDISLGVRSIPDAQIPTNALVTAGVTYRNLASYLSLDGEFASPFVPDDAAPSRPYRMLPLVVGDEMIANSRPPVQIDRLRGLDDSLRGFFPGSDGGKTVENYMRRLDPSHAAFGCSIEPFRVMSEQEIACRMYDSDEDGLPDYWETMYGMDPSDATGQNGPTGDNDLDGLNNLNEYLAGTDPWDADTNRDGIRDAATDSDMDGLSNDAEQNTFGTHPGLKDTDDDGFPDGGEVSVARDAANSLDPSLNRVLSLDGTSTSYVYYRDDERFNLPTWTIEAWVKPASFGAGSDIFARSLGGNIYNYRLRVLNDGKLSLSFTPASGGAPVVLTTTSAIPLNAWSHVSAYFRPGSPTHTLSISVNGVEVGNLQTPYQPAVEGSGLNTLRIGQTFHGLIEDARIWGTAPLYSQLTVPPTPPQPRTLDELRLPLSGTETNLVAYLRFDDSTYPMFTSGKTGWTHGQVEDFVFPNDWLDRWCNAATLAGNAEILWTGGIPTIPVPKDCLDEASIDPLYAPLVKGSNNLFGNGTIKSVNADTNAYWFCQSTVRRTGHSSMMVGGVKGRPYDHVLDATNTFLGITNYDMKNLRLKDNQSSWMETTVMGPGIVAFYWKVATEEPVFVGNEADLLTFRVNGTVQRTTSGLYDWTLVAVPVPAGLQTLRWQYTKDRFGTKYSDAAWLDDVSYLHTGADTDGDGLPDAYEVSPAYGTNPNVADSDGDGMTDGEEVLFGLNPAVANQFVINDFQLIDGKLYVRWVGMAGVKYQVQVSYDGMATWTNAPSAMALNQQSMVQAAANGDLLYCDPTVLAPGVSAVYRVTIVP